MTRVVVALDEPHGGVLAAELAREGIDVVGVLPTAGPALAARDSAWAMNGADPLPVLARAEALVLRADRETLTPDLVGLCDRLGVRIVALAERSADERLARSLGILEPLPFDADAWRIAEAAASSTPIASARSGSPAAQSEPTSHVGRVVVVWGPAGSPGRSTVAVDLAVALARGGRRTALIDADTHSPSLALALGLADEGPGFAAACRQAERGTLDTTELNRISAPLRVDGGTVEVLTGINRPARWPELSESRVTAALAVCREWVEDVVVDVAGSLESDEEIVSDLEGPRRNAATLAALRAADVVVAVGSADPLGVSRFVRGYTELRAIVGSTPVAVVANRLRPGALGIDSRGQVRRTLDRFAGISDVAFLPLDPRSADAAVLSARPIADVSPRSPFTLALRRFVDDALAPVGTASVVPMGARRRKPSRRPRVERLSA